MLVSGRVDRILPSGIIVSRTKAFFSWVMSCQGFVSIAHFGVQSLRSGTPKRIDDLSRGLSHYHWKVSIGHKPLYTLKGGAIVMKIYACVPPRMQTPSRNKALLRLLRDHGGLHQNPLKAGRLCRLAWARPSLLTNRPWKNQAFPWHIDPVIALFP